MFFPDNIYIRLDLNYLGQFNDSDASCIIFWKKKIIVVSEIIKSVRSCMNLNIKVRVNWIMGQIYKHKGKLHLIQLNWLLINSQTAISFQIQSEVTVHNITIYWSNF